MGSGRGWLGAVVARQAAGRNGRCASTGGFLVSILQQTVFYTLNMLIIQSNSLVAKAVQLHTSTVNKTRVI